MLSSKMYQDRGTPEPTSSTSNVGAILSSSVSIASPALNFTNVPDQIFTCTEQVVSWSSTGISNDPNSKSNDTTIAGIYPNSLISIGITGNIQLPTGNLTTQPFFKTIFATIVTAFQPSTNFTFNSAIPPGAYNFFAVLIVNERSDTGLSLVTTCNFTSPAFMVLNGTTTDCIMLPSVSSSSSTQGSSQTSFPSQALSSAGNHLNGGAIAGITFGSIVAVFLFFLAIAFLRLRLLRHHVHSRTISKVFGRMGMNGFSELNTRREKRDTADFIGLQSFDSSHIPPRAAKEGPV